MNEIAYAYWITAGQHLQSADAATDINNTIAQTGMAECALNMAHFAAEYPELVLGLDQIPMPDQNSPVPPGPTQGPRVWGAPK